VSFVSLLEQGLLEVAAQPRNNALDPATLGGRKLLLFPIDHDYPGGSAAMHNAVFEHYGLGYRSCFVIGDPANVGEIFAALKADPQYVGGGAGSGFKDKVAPHIDGLDESAETIGSVNVIAREDGRLIGYNTDGIGFVNGLLEEYPDCIAGQKIVILGAGGTALPIAFEMARKGPSEVVICNRTVAKAEKIAELIAPYAPARGLGEDVIGDELATAGVVVNTSNKGAQPNEAYSAFAAMTGDVDGDMARGRDNLARLPATAIVADILLEEKTTTLEMARGAGNRTHSGQHMNLHQAVPAFKIITGIEKPDEDLAGLMRAATA
jgi:shikimate dehydrogenase